MKKSFLLFLPILAYYLCHFIPSSSISTLVATGYIQDDMPYYMANAREYAEAKDFSFFYTSPFRSSYEKEAIYFQPQIFVLGMCLKYTNIPPVVLFLVFGFIFGILGIGVCLKLYNEITKKSKTLLGKVGEVLFLWGGGLFFVTGFLYHLIKSQNLHTALAYSQVLDPFDGWWFLNLGRNFLFPMEAYYHFIFFAALLAIFRKRYKTALVFAAILAFSHPFTGIALALILTVWGILEMGLSFVSPKKADLPLYFSLTMPLILAAALYYYLIFLPKSAEHAVLQQQWTLDWCLRLANILPGYALVFGLVIVGFEFSFTKLKAYLSNDFHRLLFVWLFINILLENHQYFITPHQPLHFTRGYTWSALFLIGFPLFLEIIDGYLTFFTNKIKIILIIVFSFLFCLDNITWFAQKGYSEYKGKSISFRLTKQENEALDFLKTHYYPKYLVITNNIALRSLLPTDTPYRLFYSHGANTTHSIEKANITNAFLDAGNSNPVLENRPLLLIYNTEQQKNIAPNVHLAAVKVFQNQEFLILKYK